MSADLSIFAMGLLILCVVLSGLAANAQHDRMQLLTQLRQCEASNE